MLDSCDQETPIGRRNYAILLLLSRLGLRAFEIVGLNLEDFDWDNALITVCGKGRQRAQLPLPADVGRLAAIAEKQMDALKAQKSSLIIAPTHASAGL